MGILKQGENCWRISEASRGCFLIDADAYFSDLYDAMCQAKRSIFIVGWDFDSRIHLVRKRDTPEDSLSLGALLGRLVTENQELEIYILIWDYIVFYGKDREPSSSLTMGLKTHERIHFVFDAYHPVYGSHHQKIVVIDDKIAYTGGLDLTNMRWDTPAHAARDPGRINPNGVAYQPFHDVQIRLEGSVVAHLAELCKMRWKVATGEIIPAFDSLSVKPTATEGDQDSSDFKRAKVGVARTQPAYLDLEEVREIESLHVDLIRSAHSYIYIENQYFASQLIGDEVQKRLLEREGPEVIIVLPSTQEGWIEDRTMGALRNKVISRLQEADRHGRLGIFHPRVPGVRSGIKIHSKVLIADDRYTLVGSANINNRSMGLDTECSVLLDGENDAALCAAIRGFLHRLLGEHLELTQDEIENARRAGSSLLEVIWSKRRRPRRLRSYRTKRRDWLDDALVDLEVIDLSRPLAFERYLDGTLAAVRRIRWQRLGRWLTVIGSLLGIVILCFAIRNSAPLRDSGLLNWTSQIFSLKAQHVFGPKTILGLYIVGACLFIPVNLLILATASALDFNHAVLYSLMGGGLYATIGYTLGRLLGAQRVKTFFLERLDYVLKRLGGRGLLPIVYTRILLWVPSPLVNLAAGAGHIRFSRFLAGTLIGLTPGVVLLSMAQYNILEFVANPNGVNGLICLGLLALILFWVVLFRERFLIVKRAGQ